jgi:hypothetical protein
LISWEFLEWFSVEIEWSLVKMKWSLVVEIEWSLIGISMFSFEWDKLEEWDELKMDWFSIGIKWFLSEFSMIFCECEELAGTKFSFSAEWADIEFFSYFLIIFCQNIFNVFA